VKIKARRRLSSICSSVSGCDDAVVGQVILNTSVMSFAGVLFFLAGFVKEQEDCID